MSIGEEKEILPISVIMNKTTNNKLETLKWSSYCLKIPPEYKYAMLKNNNDISPRRGIFGADFEIIDTISVMIRRIDMCNWDWKRLNNKDIVAIHIEANKSSLINQKGRINNS